MKKRLKIFTIFFTIINIYIISGCIEEEKINLNYDFYVGLEIDNAYSSIQNAIDNATDGDSIFIYNGIYNETLTINKTINLKGESNKTVIEFKGNIILNSEVILITKDNCIIEDIRINNPENIENLRGIVIESSNITLKNNTITDMDIGILIDSNVEIKYSNNTIIFNNFSENRIGLHSVYSYNNKISYNIFYLNKEYGLYLLSSNNNILDNNSFLNNNYALRIKGSRNNDIYGNNMTLNNFGLYFCCGARDNIAYNNNFIENSYWNANDGIGNIWDNGIIGNYWDDYNGTDYDENGIGDTPYNVTGGNFKDNFPLIYPI